MGHIAGENVAESAAVGGVAAGGILGAGDGPLAAPGDRCAAPDEAHEQAAATVIGRLERADVMESGEHVDERVVVCLEQVRHVTAVRADPAQGRQRFQCHVPLHHTFSSYTVKRKKRAIG